MSILSHGNHPGVLCFPIFNLRSTVHFLSSWFLFAVAGLMSFISLYLLLGQVAEPADCLCTIHISQKGWEFSLSTSVLITDKKNGIVARSMALFVSSKFSICCRSSTLAVMNLKSSFAIQKKLNRMNSSLQYFDPTHVHGINMLFCSAQNITC